MQAKCQVDMTYGDIPKQLFMFTIPIRLPGQRTSEQATLRATCIYGSFGNECHSTASASVVIQRTSRLFYRQT